MGPKVKFLVSSDDELSLKTHVQIYIYYVIYNFTVTEENFQLRQSNSNSMRIGWTVVCRLRAAVITWSRLDSMFVTSRAPVSGAATRCSLRITSLSALVTSIFITVYSLITSPLGGLQSIVMSMSVCLSVCLLAYLWNHTTELNQIFVDVTYGRGSVLLWRRCD